MLDGADGGHPTCGMVAALLFAVKLDSPHSSMFNQALFPKCAFWNFIQVGLSRLCALPLGLPWACRTRRMDLPCW